MSRALTLAALVGTALPLVAAARSPVPFKPELLPRALVFSPDGETLLSIDWRGQRALIDARSGAWDYYGGKLPEEGASYFHETAVARESGMALAYIEGYRLVRWNSAAPPTGEVSGPQLLHSFQEKPRGIVVDAKGHAVAALDGNGEVVVYRGRRRLEPVFADGLGAPFSSRRAPAGSWPTAVAASPGGETIAVGFETGAVRLVDSSHPAPEGSKEAVTALAFDTNGSHLVAARSGSITLYAVAESLIGGQQLAKIRSWEAPGKVTQLAVSPAGGLVVHAMRDEAPWIAHLGAEGEVRHQTLPAAGAYSPVMAMSPDGKLLACNDGSYGLAIYDLATGEEVTRILDRQDDDGKLPWSPGKGPRGRVDNGVPAPKSWLGK